MTRRIVTSLLLAAGLLLGMGYTAPTVAADGSATVSYVTVDGFYLDAGSAIGLAVGDTVRVTRGGDTVATGVVMFVAESNASCQLVRGEVEVGDGAVFTVAETMAPGEEPVVAAPEVEAAAASAMRRREARSGPEVNELDGRIGVQLRYQTDDESGHDVTEPGMTARLRVRNLFGTAHTLSVRARSRRITRDRQVGNNLLDQWNNRVYEVALEYDQPASAFGYRVGRITANRIRGVGSFDGAYADYAVTDDWTVGAFYGMTPDPTTSRINPDDTKTGAFISTTRGDYSGHRVDGTVALAGSYRNGEIDQEYVYQQLRYSIGRGLSLYESAELAINRGWRKDSGASSLELDNVLLSMRIQPVDGLSFDAGYDNRRILRTWETRTTPDSLFDDSVREGWRLGGTARLTRDLRLTAQGNLRTGGSAGDALAANARLSHRDLFESGISADLRVAIYESPYSTGIQPSVGLARYLVRAVRLSLEGGARSYEFDQGSIGRQTDLWVRPALSASLGRHLYGMLSTEITRGDLENTMRAFTELGYRF